MIDSDRMTAAVELAQRGELAAFASWATGRRCSIPTSSDGPTDRGARSRGPFSCSRGIGADPQRQIALGAGFGLERCAVLRYGIDDVRKVAAARVA